MKCIRAYNLIQHPFYMYHATKAEAFTYQAKSMAACVGRHLKYTLFPRTFHIISRNDVAYSIVFCLWRQNKEKKLSKKIKSIKKHNPIPSLHPCEAASRKIYNKDSRNVARASYLSRSPDPFPCDEICLFLFFPFRSSRLDSVKGPS